MGKFASVPRLFLGSVSKFDDWIYHDNLQNNLIENLNKKKILSLVFQYNFLLCFAAGLVVITLIIYGLTEGSIYHSFTITSISAALSLVAGILGLSVKWKFPQNAEDTTAIITTQSVWSACAIFLKIGTSIITKDFGKTLPSEQFTWILPRIEEPIYTIGSKIIRSPLNFSHWILW